MAETALPATAIHVVPIRQHVTIVAEAQDLGLEASDDVNGNYFVPSGKDLIIALNTDVGAQTVSIDCAPVATAPSRPTASAPMRGPSLGSSPKKATTTQTKSTSRSVTRQYCSRC